jgi:hypothetical protein
MVSGSSDPMTTPGDSPDERFHYLCNGSADCAVYELVQTILADDDRKQCLEHHRDLELCKEANCKRLRKRHRVP